MKDACICIQHLHVHRSALREKVLELLLPAESVRKDALACHTCGYVYLASFVPFPYPPAKTYGTVPVRAHSLPAFALYARPRCQVP